MKFKIQNYLPHLAAFAILALPVVASAQSSYKLLSPLAEPFGGIGPANQAGSYNNLADYLKAAFRIAVGLAGLIAVTILIIGGIEYVSSGISGNEAARSSAHKRIWDAITGLVLALTGYLILQTINPALVNFQLEIQPITSGGATSSGGNSPIVNPATGETFTPNSAQPSQTTSQTPTPESSPQSQTTVVNPNALIPANAGPSRYTNVANDPTIEGTYRTKLMRLENFRGSSLNTYQDNSGIIHVQDSPLISGNNTTPQDGETSRVMSGYTSWETFTYDSASHDWILSK
ncbi:MAG: pilin [Candidatus Paceibacterota bacterium]|jgi:hypothetical protein